MASAIVFIVLCTTFLALRFISIKIGRRHISIEDWLILPAWALEIGLCANVICSTSRDDIACVTNTKDILLLGVVYSGVGNHEAYVLEFEPHALVSWAQTLFATELLYGILFPIEKTAILLL
jgi:hypothetical protein